MKRTCFLLRVKKDRLDEYKRRHAAVWPDMLEALRQCGWRNYSLFLSEDGLLVGYVETDDFDASVACMQKQEVNARWQADMAPFFEQTAGQAADKALLRLEEVFHLD
jgi:L-rhamnose mutarotase